MSRNVSQLLRPDVPQEAIALALEVQTEEQRDFLSIEWAEDPAWCVQFPAPESSSWRYAEADADVWKAPRFRISEEGQAVLRRLGWRPPKPAGGWDGKPESVDGSAWDFSSQDPEEWKTPNWAQVFRIEEAEPYLAVAKVLLATLQTAYGPVPRLLKLTIGGARSGERQGPEDTPAVAGDGWSRPPEEYLIRST